MNNSQPISKHKFDMVLHNQVKWNKIQTNMVNKPQTNSFNMFGLNKRKNK